MVYLVGFTIEVKCQIYSLMSYCPDAPIDLMGMDFLYISSHFLSRSDIVDRPSAFTKLSSLCNRCLLKTASWPTDIVENVCGIS